MAGIYTMFGIGTTLLIMFFTVFFWGLSDLASINNITVDDLYKEMGGDISSQQQKHQEILFESQEIARQSSLDEQATDTAQAQGDISAVKNTAGTQNIIQSFISQFNSLLPYHTAINTAILSILVILLIAASLYIIIGRIP